MVNKQRASVAAARTWAKKNPEAAELIMIGVLAAGMVTAPAVAPAAFAALGYAGRAHRAMSRQRARVTMYNLKRRGDIAYEHVGHDVRLVLTEQGKQRAVGAQLCLNRTTSKRWDGKWRLVLFDIPTELRTARDALRHLLKRLGFVQLQKSAWIYPYDCAEEIRFLRSFFNISEEQLRYIVVEQIGEDSTYRKRFKL